MTATTRDAFLDGRIVVDQPAKGYRAGIDPVLLAAATPAWPGQSVLELGLGAGVASLCLAARVPDLRLTGVERQADYADYARVNAALNDIPLNVVVADLTDLPADLRQERFDHVIANPPYFVQGRTAATDQSREEALAEDTPLEIWIDVASRRLAPKGQLTMIHRAERLPDLMAALAPRLGALRIAPLASRIGRDAQLILVNATKSGRTPARLLAPVILHEGPKHLRDGDDYAPEVRAVLRDSASLNVFR